MSSNKISLLIISIVLNIFLFIPIKISAQAFPGYTLFSPNNSRYTYLVDMNNQVVHTWTHTKSGGYSAYLLEDGSIIRPALSTNSSLGGGGEAGVVQRVSWDNVLLWEYTYSSSTLRTHHDIEPMPNGNVLLIAWEVKTAAQAVEAGLSRNAAIWPDHIVEIQPVGTTGGNLVWQWHAWDHLIQNYNSAKNNYGVVASHPELLNINMGSSGIGMGGGDWMHINGISYNAELDQIVISSHNLNEIYVIDHSTTTAEAASHSGGKSGKGGDILYRWGNPSNYGASGTRVFNVVHCSSWIPGGLPGGGNILAFNNREGQGTSMVVELIPPKDASGNYSLIAGSAYGPASPTWSYTSTGFYSNHLGGVQRLPNGNTLIVESTSGYIFEVNSSGTVMWSYNRGGEIARALRYSTTYPGLKFITAVVEEISLPSNFELMQNFPNPFNPQTNISYQIPESCFVTIKVFDSMGKEVATLVDEYKQAGSYNTQFSISNSQLSTGVYFYTLRAGSNISTKKMLLLK